jgi:hypothetical protein
MTTRPPQRRVTWRTIVVLLAAAAFLMWLIGFGAGLIVRIGYGR